MAPTFLGRRSGERGSTSLSFVSEPAPPIQVDVWTDLVCPWCYIGKRRLERAVSMYEGTVAVRYRSFELDPRPSRAEGQTLPERLAAKYGVSVAQAMAMNDRVSAVAAGEGLRYRLDLACPANTFDAHRLVHLAASKGLAGEMVERLKAAYFCEGCILDDRATLAELAGQVGMDDTEARLVLQGDGYRAEVRADEDLARQLDIHGVPFFVFDGRYGLSGAQEAEVLARVMRQVARERQEATAPS